MLGVEQLCCGVFFYRWEQCFRYEHLALDPGWQKKRKHRRSTSWTLTPSAAIDASSFYASSCKFFGESDAAFFFGFGATERVTKSTASGG